MERLPLHAIRILDLTLAWTGPYAARLLADMGAEVLKIQAVDRRHHLPAPSGAAAHSDRSKWACLNHLDRNKYACTLDLRHRKGKELFLRLVAISDAVIEDYGPATLSDLGLAYDALRSVKGDIILLSLGSDGANAEQVSGLAGINRVPSLAGVAAAGALALALWHRRRTGDGQHVEVPLRESVISLIGEYIVGYSMSGRLPQPMGNRHSSMAPHGYYPCASKDQWVTIAVADDDQFAALCRAMGRAELTDDPRFADVVSRYRHQDELDAIVAAWTRERTPEQATRALQAAGVAAAPVLTAQALLADRHLRARGFWESVAHPEAGVGDVSGVVWRMSRSPRHIRLPAPRFGEHNRYVLSHLLGLSEKEIQRLAAAGVIANAPDPAVQQ